MTKKISMSFFSRSGKITLGLVLMALSITGLAGGVFAQSAPNLAGLWHMDGSWADASGNGNYTGVNGGSFSDYARVGSKAGSLNAGTSDFVRVKSGALIGNSPQSTIMAWVNPNSFKNSPRIYTEDNANGDLFSLSISESGQVRFNIWRSDISGNWATAGSNSVLQLNTWSHVAATLDSTGMKVYVNGVLSGTNSVNVLPSNNVITYSQIGAVWVNQYQVIGKNFYSGLLDEVAVYKRALSGDEIFQSYKEGLGFMAQWQMEGNWADSSGNGNIGTPAGSAAFSSDTLFGSQSGSFNGLDSAVTGTASSLPLGNSPRTITAWLKSSSGTQSRSIIQYGAGPAGKFQFALDNQNRAVFGSDSGEVTGATSLADGQWHYVVGVYEGTGTNMARIYVDNILQNSGTLATPVTINGDFAIGSFLDNSGHFNGLLDEVTLHNRAFPAAEIAKTYNDGLSRIALWHMDGDWTDASGNSNKATAYNGVAFSSDAVISGQSGSYDGVNDYLTVPYNSMNPLFNLETRLTYELWVKPLSAGPLIAKGRCGNPWPAAELRLGGTSPNFDLKFILNSSNANTATTFTAPAAVPYNKWAHLVATYDKGSQTVKMYVNGLNVLSESYGQILWKPTKDMLIGAISECSAYYRGLIEGAAVYNRALSAEEVANNCTFVTTPAPTVTILSPAAGYTNDNTPQLNYTVIDGIVSVRVDGQPVSKVSGDSLDLLSEGTHTVVVQAVGSNNKLGIATTSFTVDTIAPALSINPISSPTNTTSQTITGTMNGASTVSVSVNTTAVAGSVTYPTSTTWKCTISNLAWGPNVVTATTTDTAGNSTTATATIDQYGLNISNVAVSSNSLNVSTPNTVSIFFTIDNPAMVTLKIVPQTQGTSGTPVYQAAQDCPAAGAYQFIWDGKDNAGKVVSEEAYLYVLESVVSGVSMGIYSPAATGSTETTSLSPSGDADPYSNNPMTLNFSLSRPSRMQLYVGYLYDLKNLTSPYNYVIKATGYYIWSDQPRLSGNYTLSWDGRDREGKVIWRKGTNFAVSAIVTPLPENYIIVTSDAAPQISDVVIDPYKMDLSYGQFTRIKYNLSINANVTVSLISPNGSSTTLLNNEAQTAGDHEFDWDGLDPSDTSGKKSLIASSGSYTIKIQAVNPVSGKSSSPAWRNLQIGY